MASKQESSGKTAPPAGKKPTPTQLKAENEDLREALQKRTTTLRDREILLQKARDILKSEGTPGMSMNQDHFRIAGMIKEKQSAQDIVLSLIQETESALKGGLQWVK